MLSISKARSIRNAERPDVCDWCQRPERADYEFDSIIEEHHLCRGCHRMMRRMSKEDWNKLWLAVLCLARASPRATFRELLDGVPAEVLRKHREIPE